MNEYVHLIKAVFAAKIRLNNKGSELKAFIDSTDAQIDEKVLELWIYAATCAINSYKEIKRETDSGDMRTKKAEELRMKARALVCLKVSDLKFAQHQAYNFMVNINVD